MTVDTDWIIGLSSLALIGIGFPVIVFCAAQGKIPPNPMLGIRVGSIDQSDFVWQSAHRAALPMTIVSGACAITSVFASCLSYNAPDSRTFWLVTGYVAFLIAGTAAAIIAYFKARICALDAPDAESL